MKFFPCLLAVFGVAGAANPLSLSRYSVDSPPRGDKPLKRGDVEFHFYSRDNLERPVVLSHEINDWEIPGQFKSEEELVVIIHGFTGSAQTASVVLIRDAVLQSRSANVILVQWQNLAVGPWYDEASLNCAKVAPLLADAIRKFDQFAAKQQAPNLIQQRTHIIGFSLGSQVAGLTGSQLNSSIARITGLDPAKPIFDQLEDDARLDSSDARFVMVIHTAGGFLAFKEPVGHADFYPNGGSEQPGCDNGSGPGLVCNHFRAYEYFVESIYEPRAFPTKRCDSWETYVDGSCDGANEPVYMGYTTPNTTRGTYYLRTNPEAPFGQGESKYIPPTTTTTTSTTTTTEQTMIDPMKEWLEEKGQPSNVEDPDNSLIDSRSLKAGASTNSLSLLKLSLLLACYRIFVFMV